MTLTLDQTRKIISTTNVVLIVAVALSVLLIARDAVVLSGSGGISEDKTADQKNSVESAKRLSFKGYALVLQNNVFGYDAGKLETISSTTSHSQQSVSSPARTALMVFGTVAWDGGAGYAFIKDEKNKQAVIKTGDMIPGSGKLERVYADKIVISINGAELEINTMQVQPADNSTADAPEQNPAKNSKKGFARQTGDGQYVVDRIAVEESISNPNRLLKDARMLPHYNKSKVQQGFSLSEVKKGGIYDTLGLKNKDILLGVNGLELSDPSSALQAFTAIKGSNNIQVDILRNNSPMTLRYTLR